MASLNKCRASKNVTCQGISWSWRLQDIDALGQQEPNSFYCYCKKMSFVVPRWQSVCLHKKILLLWNRCAPELMSLCQHHKPQHFWLMTFMQILQDWIIIKFTRMSGFLKEANPAVNVWIAGWRLWKHLLFFNSFTSIMCYCDDVWTNSCVTGTIL